MKMTLNESAILGILAEEGIDVMDLVRNLRADPMRVAQVLLGNKTDDVEIQRIADGFRARNPSRK